MYPTLGLDNLLQRGLTVIVIAILASFYPAREAAHEAAHEAAREAAHEAAHSEPAKALHYV